MRIGYLTYGLDRAPTGIGRYAVGLLRALATIPNGPQIVLLTTERTDHHRLWDRFERHALPGCRLLPALLTLGNLAVSRAARRYRLDLVHDPNGIAPFLGPQGKVRRVVTIHDTFAYVASSTTSALDRWRYRHLLPRAVCKADVVLTDSHCSRSDLVRHLKLPPERVHVVHLGIDPCFAPVPEGAARRIARERYGIRLPYALYVGGINARKNIARLFQAYALVRRHHPDLTLVVAGKRQWQTAEIDAVFRQLGLEPYVQFTGYVADADLPALYSAAEVFVFPSLYEGFGLPPLEAMACGTPVVTSNVSSLPEVVGDAALTIDPYDVAGLAAAIERVLADAALRAELRAKGLARAQQFTWEHAARATLAVYEQVLGKERTENRGLP